VLEFFVDFVEDGGDFFGVGAEESGVEVKIVLKKLKK
jgi:hypothetical protein